MPRDQYYCEKCGTAHKEPSKVYSDHMQYKKVEPSKPQPPMPPVPVDGNTKMIGIVLLEQDGKILPVSFTKGDLNIAEALEMLKHLENYIMTRKMEASKDGR